MTTIKALILLAGVPLFAMGCAQPDEPTNGWQDLSIGYTPSIQVGEREWEDEAGNPSPVVPDKLNEGMWLVQKLDDQGWTQLGDGTWKKPRPDSFISRTRMNAKFELIGPEGVIKRVYSLTEKANQKPEAVSLWITKTDDMIFQDARLTAAPSNLVFREHVERGKMVEGRRRVVVGGVRAYGLDVWPGEEVVREVHPRGESTLRFSTAASGSKASASATFIVRRGNEELFRHEQAVFTEDSEVSATVAHSIQLPAVDGSGLRLSFVVEGDANITAFLEPTVGPRDIGTYGARPWGQDRPNLIIFLADTMRADCLSASGGDPDLMPNLNRVAEQSLLFSNARSPASWTLPSHVSLFTALFPKQHGVMQFNMPLNEKAVTFADQFARYGYRTGAVTDSIFISRSYGLDQGFSWFDEHQEWYEKKTRKVPPLAATLRNALEFLDRDDGRPVLLFVHTYRLHTPYRGDASEDATANDMLRDLRVSRLREAGPGANMEEALGDYVDRYRKLYFDGVAQFDSDFGGFWDGLDKRGLNDTSIFCFTSDHGEAFFEHGSSGHSKSTHEEQVDIPMFVRAPGLAPKVVSEEVSLIDLPRTFAELAEIPLAPEWGGRSLVQELVEQPVFSVHDDEWAIVYGKKKVFFQLGQSLEITAAYDLESDPSEMVNLVDTVDWPLELLDISKPEILRLNKRQLSSGEQELSNEMRDRLETLGYVGD